MPYIQNIIEGGLINSPSDDDLQIYIDLISSVFRFLQLSSYEDIVLMDRTSS
jgi:hypothetical protein